MAEGMAAAAAADVTLLARADVQACLGAGRIATSHLLATKNAFQYTAGLDLRCTLPQTLAGSQQPTVLVALKYWHTRSAPQQNVLRPLPLNIDVE